MNLFKKCIAVLSLIISTASLTAEVIVVKKAGNTITMLNPADKNNYLGNPIKEFGTSNSIFDLIYKYQWPTCYLFYPEMSDNEKNQLFAQTPNAETNFINQKIQASYPEYQAISILNTVYQLFAALYYLKNYASNESKVLRDYLFNYFDNFSSDKSSGYPQTAFESNAKFLQDCKNIYADPVFTQAHFTINCELGKYLNQKSWLNTIQDQATLKIVAADLLNNIIQTYQAEKALLTNPNETRSKETQSKRFNFEKFKDELDGNKLKNEGIIARLIDAEFNANQKNQALLVRGTGAFKQPITTDSGVVLIENLASSLRYKTLGELYKKYRALQDPNNNYWGGWNPKFGVATSASPCLQPRSLSYGLFPFTGSFYCIHDMPYDYAREPQFYFYSLSVPKGEYCKNHCDELFLLPPFCALSQLFGHSTAYHGFSKVAIPHTQMNNVKWGVDVDGFEFVRSDADKVLLLERDPIEQAALLTDFTAKHFTLLKEPISVTQSLADEENRLRTDAINAEKFYKSFLANPESIVQAKKEEAKIRKQDPPTMPALQAGAHPISTVWASIAHSKQEPSYVGTIRDAGDKKDIFINDCKKYSSLNAKIPQHTQGDGLCRVATYNVHFWTNPHEYENFEKIMQAIQTINADILILEEFTWGNESSNYASEILREKYPDEQDKLLNQANTEIGGDDWYAASLSDPSFWDKQRARLTELCVQALKDHNEPTSPKEEILQRFKNFGYIDHIFADAPDKPGSSPFGNVVFSKYKIKERHVAFYSTGYKKAKRSYAKAVIELPENKSVVVYGTHLDVNDATGKTRAAQIQELTQIIDADKTNHENILVAGDFNEIRSKQDYQHTVGNKKIWNLLKRDYAQRKESIATDVAQILTSDGFTDSFDQAHAARPKFTVWSGTTVDFIYLKDWSLPVDGSYVLYDAASDHIPVILDITLKPKEPLAHNLGQLSQKLSALKQELTTLNAQLNKLHKKVLS